MADASFSNGALQERIRRASGWLLWIGVAMIALGIVALIFPLISTVVAALLVGWSLFFFGCITVAGSFSIHGAGSFFGAFLVGLLSIAAGLFLLFNPLAGAVALTIVAGFVFIMQSAFEISFAFEMRPHPGWVGMLISGLASAVVAILIAARWPSISLVLLGILLGVNFITTGVGYIALCRAIRPFSTTLRQA